MRNFSPCPSARESRAGKVVKNAILCPNRRDIQYHVFSWSSDIKSGQNLWSKSLEQMGVATTMGDIHAGDYEAVGDQLRIKDPIPGLQDLGSSGLVTELPDDSAKPTSCSKAEFSILKGTARPWEARSIKHVRWTFTARQRLFEGDVMFAEEQVTTNLPLS